jgi:hypothetical protein
MVDYTHQTNEAGTDQVVMNQRTRANNPGNNAQGVMWMTGTGVATSYASGAGAQTLTAAILGGGLIIHNLGASTNVTDTTDTAANIYAYMVANSAGVNVGDILQVQCVSNTGTGTSVLTIAPGTNVTLDANGVGTIAAGVSKTLNFRCTAVGATPAFTLYM